MPTQRDSMLTLTVIVMLNLFTFMSYQAEAVYCGDTAASFNQAFNYERNCKSKECDAGERYLYEYRGTVYCDCCEKGKYEDDCTGSSYNGGDDDRRRGSYSGSSCKSCGKGKYNNYDGAAGCFECSKGTYQSQKGQTNCKKCSKGEYANEKGMEDCKSCRPGTVAPEEGAEECTDCEKGKHQSSWRQQTCDECDKGYYSDETGLADCKECPKGYFTDETGREYCDKCGVGKYSDEAKSTSCKNCKVGHYQNQEGREDCKECPKGTYADVEKLETCKDCPVGHYMDEVKGIECKACQAGQYQKFQGQEDCDFCGAGKYQNEEGQEDCKVCSPGKFTDSDGANICEDHKICQRGQYVSAEGTASSDRQCLDCDINTYSDTENAPECTPCGPGFFQDQTGQSGCQAQDINCAPGTYRTNTSPPQCIDCDPGYFTDSPNQAQCIEHTTCSAGWRVTQQPSSTQDRKCERCPIGSYSDTPDSNSCTPCDGITEFQPLSGQTQCNQVRTCNKGSKVTQAPTATRNRECETCVLGDTYQPFDNQPDCLAVDTCDVGEHEVLEPTTSSNRQCGPCDGSEEFQDEAGQLDCKSARLCGIGFGKIQDPTDTTDRICEACVEGFYSDENSKDGCKPVSECGIGQGLSQNATSSSDVSCSACGNNLFKATAGNFECQTTSSCDTGEMEVFPPTTSTDRLCNSIILCENGTDLLTSDECSCPSGEACQSCIAGDVPGFLLFRKGGLPSADPISGQDSFTLDANLPVEDLKLKCAEKCDEASDCQAFHLFVTGPARGACTLKKAYQTEGEVQVTAAADFYIRQSCDECLPGFAIVNGFCLPTATGPTIDAHPAKITIAMTTTTADIYTFSATPDGTSAGPVSYSISTTATNIEIDSSSGVMKMTSAFTSPKVVKVDIVVTDSRPSCTVVEGNKVFTNDGGCKSSTSIELAVADLIGCSDDIDVYLTSESSAQVDIGTASLPEFVGSITVSSSLGSLNPVQTFNLGDHEVTFSTSNFDIGGSLSCTFTVSVSTGFFITAEDVGYVGSATKPLDFILDGAQISGGGLLPPIFTGEVVGQKFGLGIRPPARKLFNIALKEDFSTQLIIDLSWCSDGGSLSGRENLLQSVPTTIELTGAPEITFTDTGSGIFSDGTCFSIKAVSDGAITDKVSFSAISLSIDSSSLVARRRNGALQNYQPVGTNMIVFQHTPGTNSPSDPGSMIVINDLEPPVWVGCPDVVTAYAPPGSLQSTVHWDEPVATDNVQVLDIQQTAISDVTIFTIVDSPHTVTYTASDGIQTSDCEFQVVVDFLSTDIELSAETPSISFDQSQNALLGLTEVSYSLIDPYAAGLSFVSDMANITSISVRLDVAAGDEMLVRPTTDALFAQFEFDLTWVASDASQSSLSQNDPDMKITVAFENFKATADSDVTEEFVLDQFTAAVDPVTGVAQVSGFSRIFHHDLSFTAMILTIDFPSARPGTGIKQYSLQFNSDISVRFFFDTSNAPSAADLTSYPLLIPVDNIAPTIRSCPSNIQLSAALNSAGRIVSWTEPTATDNRGTPSLTSNYNPGLFVPIRKPNSARVKVTYTAKDLFGNTASCSFTIRITDTQDPDMTCKGTQNLVLEAGKSEMTITPSMWNPDNLDDNSNYSPTIIQPIGSFDLGYGSHDVSIVAQDEWNNAVTCTTTFNIDDVEPPTITCPTLNPVSGNTDGTPTLVLWNDPTAEDNDQVDSVVVSIPSGSTFEVGDTNVTATATDRAGNQAQCSFVITVVAPVSQNSQAASSVIGGAAAGAGVLLIVCIFLLVVFIQARNRYKNPQKWEDIFAMIDQLKNKDQDGIKEPRELQRAQITILEELGMGAFGVVSKGLLKEGAGPGYLIAIKSLHPKASSSDRTELLEEAAIMAQFEHPHVVQLIGVVTVGRPLLVVLEFMEYGSLKSFLEKEDVSLGLKLKFAGDCASGLNHIHENCFVHRDVAARNVLISSEKRCKIADFGLARDTAEDTYYRSRGGQLPVRWSAPEALDDRVFNESTDVWSFGILLYEIWTRAAMPYEGENNAKVWVKVSAGYRLPQPDECPKDIYNTMLNCWDAEPSFRPNFEHLESFFRNRFTEETGETLNGYLDINEEEEEMEKTSTLSKLGSFFRRLSSRKDRKNSTSSKSSTMLVENPAFEEEDEPLPGAALYDMGDDGEDAPEQNDPNAALYDMASPEQEMQQQVEDPNAALYDMASPEQEMQQNNDGMYDLASPEQKQIALEELGDSKVDISAGVIAEPDGDNYGFDGTGDLYNNFGNDGMMDAPEETERPATESDVGARVRVSGYECLGTLRFWGYHKEKKTLRCGVELDDPVGKNNGTVGGHKYFKCPDKYGVLCVPRKVTVVE